MAPGLKVGNQVKAKAVNVLGNRRAGDVFGPWAAKSELHGSVQYRICGCRSYAKTKG